MGQEQSSALLSSPVLKTGKKAAFCERGQRHGMVLALLVRVKMITALKSNWQYLSEFQVHMLSDSAVLFQDFVCFEADSHYEA